MIIWYFLYYIFMYFLSRLYRNKRNLTRVFSWQKKSKLHEDNTSPVECGPAADPGHLETTKAMEPTLLFFDTFSHDVAGAGDLNLDLVQFPSPVLVSELRIIPLGARVQANFPGGVRLGATNPTQFTIDFFVNDLSRPGAATFEKLGSLNYDQAGQIRLQCPKDGSAAIATDGLVLRGKYNTITLAVYGTLSKATAEQLAYQGQQEQRQRAKEEEKLLAQKVAQKQQQQPQPQPQHHYQHSPPQYHRYGVNGERSNNPEHPIEHHANGDGPLGNRGHSRSPPPARYSHGGHRERSRESANRLLGPNNEPVPVLTSPPVKDEPVAPSKDELMDDISDISDGDIPEMEEVEDVAEPVANESNSPTKPTEPENGDIKGKGDPDSIPAGNSNNRHSLDHQSGPSPSPGEQMMEMEMMEEISDDEAEWSDVDGTATYDQELEESEFEAEGFEEILRPFSLEGYKLEPLADEYRECVNEEVLVGIKGSVASILEISTPNAEWIEELEQLMVSLERTSLPDRGEEALVADIVRIARLSLSMDAAMKHNAPTLKVRHLKQGLRFVCAAFAASQAAGLALITSGIQRTLLSFLKERHISPTICVTALNVLDLSLNHKQGYEVFTGLDKRTTNGDSNHKQTNLYLELCQLTKKLGMCAKPSLTALLAKVTFVSATWNLVLSVKTLKGDEKAVSSDIEHMLAELLSQFKNARTKFAQPSKLLPAQFRFQPTDEHYLNPFPGIFMLFKQAGLIDALLTVLAQPTRSLRLSKICLSFIENISLHDDGLRIFRLEWESTNELLSLLLKSNSIDEQQTAHKLGYSVQCQDVLKRLFVIQRTSRTFIRGEIVDQLQMLSSLTTDPLGRQSVAKVLGGDQYLSLLVLLIRDSLDASTEEEDENMTLRPAIRGYACEFIKLALRHCENVRELKHVASTIADLANDEEVAKISETIAWTRPLIDHNSFTSEEIPGLCELVKKNVENISPLSLELVTAARIVATFVNDTDGLHAKYCLASLHSNGIAEHYTVILTKICSYHAQPSLHIATFVGHNGFLLLSLIKPIIRTLKCLLQNLIACRGTEFKDTSTVNLLLRVYNLARVVPRDSICYELSIEIRDDIVDALSAFTLPDFDLSNKSLSVQTSLWTMMLKEVMTYTSSLPHTYRTGLCVLNRLLPLELPLPVPSSDKEVTDEESAVALNARKLWSTHLFAAEKTLNEMLVTLVSYSDSDLACDLKRTVELLTDLSPVVSKIVCEAILEALANNMSENLELNSCGVSALAFMSSAFELSQIKSTMITLLTEKDHNKSVWTKLCACLNGEGQNRVKISFLKSSIHLLDTKVTMLSATSSDSEVLLANSLPAREILEPFIYALLELTFDENSKDVTILSLAIQSLGRLIYHDYGFTLIRHQLEKQPQVICNLVDKLASLPETPVYLSVLNESFTFLKALCETSPGRTLILSEGQMRTLVSNEAVEEEAWGLIKDRIGQAEAQEGNADKSMVTSQVDWLKSKHAIWMSVEPAETSMTNDEDSMSLPPMKSLLDLYSERPLFGEKALHPNHQLASVEMEIDSVELDLVEIASTCMPQDFDISAEVRQVCDEKSLETDKQLKKIKKKSAMERKALHNKNIISSFRAGANVNLGGGGRGGRPAFARPGQRPDGFRSRPPNTSRPPSLHVDDFLVLQQRGQQPTGPTGYNKQSIKAAKELFAQREAQQNLKGGSIVGFREATKEPVFDPHMDSRDRGRGRRGSGPPGAGPGYRGRGNGLRNSRGWSPTQAGSDGQADGNERRFGSNQPPRRGPMYEDGPRRGGGRGRGRDRRRFGGRDEGRPPMRSHMRRV